jgi:hypothetical protein
MYYQLTDKTGKGYTYVSLMEEIKKVLNGAKIRVDEVTIKCEDYVNKNDLVLVAIVKDVNAKRFVVDYNKVTKDFTHYQYLSW